MLWIFYRVNLTNHEDFSLVEMNKGGKDDFQIEVNSQEDWENLMSTDGLKGTIFNLDTT